MAERETGNLIGSDKVEGTAVYGADQECQGELRRNGKSWQNVSGKSKGRLKATGRRRLAWVLIVATFQTFFHVHHRMVRAVLHLDPTIWIGRIVLKPSPPNPCCRLPGRDRDRYRQSRMG